MKKNDIVSWKVLDKTLRGKVNWVNGENVGITLIGEEYHGVEATVMPIEDCTVVIEYKGDALQEEIASLSIEELKESIQRLKGMRLPRKVKGRVRRSVSPRRREKMTRLLEVIDGDPNALDALISKALEDEKEVKE